MLGHGEFANIVQHGGRAQCFGFVRRKLQVSGQLHRVHIDALQVVVHRRQDAADFCDMIVDQFDEMLAQSERHPLVMNVSVHTYVFGQPFRLRRLRLALQHCRGHAAAARVWWTRPGEIADFCIGMAPGVLPGS